jgi:hypothetical protein
MGIQRLFLRYLHSLLVKVTSASEQQYVCSSHTSAVQRKQLRSRYSLIPHYNSFCQPFILHHYFLNGCCTMNHKLHCTVVIQLLLFRIIRSCIPSLFPLPQSSTILIKKKIFTPFFYCFLNSLLQICFSPNNSLHEHFSIFLLHFLPSLCSPIKIFQFDILLTVYHYVSQ